MYYRGLLVLICFLFSISSYGKKYYVVGSQSNNSGDGLSWATAKKSVQDALNLAVSGDSVWVAAGTYHPTMDPLGSSTPTDSRNKSFFLRAGIKLYGGFAGTEKLLSDRITGVNITTLSGDIANTPSDNSDDCYHVIIAYSNNSPWIAPESIIDGIKIINSNANGNTSIRLLATSTTNTDEINQELGAGIFSLNCCLKINKCLISGNAAAVNGGGIYFTGQQTNTVSNCIIDLNSANGGAGGGIYINGSNTVIYNNVIAVNTARTGGGIATYDKSNNTIAFNTFYGNTNGGALHSNNCINTISYNIFWANVDGGSSTSPGSDYKELNSDLSVFTGNSMQLSSSSYTASGQSQLDPGSGNNIFANDPKFSDASNYLSNGFALKATSPCKRMRDIGIKNLSKIFMTDILGNTRREDQQSVGAYEYVETENIRYVDATLSTSGNGTSWALAYKTLDEALKAAFLDATITRINVTGGLFYPTHKPYNNNGTEMTTTDVADKTFHIRDGLSIYGGYPKAGIGTRIPGTSRLEGNNTYHVIVAAGGANASGVTIDGFTIADGHANGEGSINVNGLDISRSVAGGIVLNNGSNVISNNLISDNSSTDMNGAIFIYKGNCSIYGNKIYSNESEGDGGAIGIISKGGLCNIYANMIGYNSTERNGSAISAMDGVVIVSNNTIIGNKSGDSRAGAAYCRTNMIFNNNVFWLNSLNNISSAVGADFLIGYGGSGTFNNNLLQLSSAASYVPAASGSITSNFQSLGSAGNLYNVDPQFENIVDPYNYGLRLNTGSLCIGSGKLSPYSPNFDIVGNPFLSVTDIGAFSTASKTNANVATIKYVDGSIAASGDGASWTTAYKTLDEALQVAFTNTNIQYIYIAQGTYTPSKKPYDNNGVEISTTDARDVTFHVRDGLKIIGSYASGGTGVPDINAHPTILSGNINDQQANWDNTYHVLIGGDQAGIGISLTGLVIADGYAIDKGTTPVAGVLKGTGGGICLKGASNKITNCIIKKNVALTGGGIYITDGGGVINNCSIENNRTMPDDAVNNGNDLLLSSGGGLCVNSVNNALIMYNTSFNSNTCYNKGGGLYTSTMSILMGNCTFIGNRSSNSGGGIYTYSSNIKIYRSLISNNLGGGNFDFNEADMNGGGGVYMSGFKIHFYQNYVISNNASTATGGGILIKNDNSFEDTTLKIHDNVFANNIAFTGYAMGVQFTSFGGSHAIQIIAQNTFVGNQTPYEASAIDYLSKNGGQLATIEIHGTGTGIIANNIFGINGTGVLGKSIDFRHSTETSIENNLFQNNDANNCVTWWSSLSGAGYGKSVNNKYLTDPQFVNPNNILGTDNLPFTADDGLRLSSGSPCAYGGMTVFYKTFFRNDILNRPRDLMAPTIGAFKAGN